MGMSALRLDVRVATAVGLLWATGWAQILFAGNSATDPASPEQAAGPIQREGQIMPTPDYTGSFAERSTMTGDWGGTRQDLANHGITLDAYLAQVWQGVVSGGRETGSQYMGRGQIDLNLDTARMGLWPGGLFSVIGEGHYGNSIASNTGSVFPVNSNELFPQSDDGFVVPQVTYTQFVSKQLGFFVGKIATIGGQSGDVNEFAYGKGDEQFLNTSLSFTPIAAVTIPYSTLGFGTVVIPVDDLQLTGLVLDPHGTADSGGFDTLFADGATFSVVGRYRTHFFDMTGHQLLGGAYSTSSYADLDQRAVNFVIPGLPTEKADNSWCVFYNGDQYFYQPDPKVDRGVGVFGRVGRSDGIANPIKWFASAGVAGKGMIPGREYDQFGIGYYYAWAADTQIPSVLGFGDAQGVETYYQFAVTRWAQLSPDIQWIRPSQQNVDSSWILGLRLKLIF